MNKTQWLFSCVISVTLLSSLITSADLNAAPLTGTMNYNERINPRPCVLHSNEQSKKLPDYSIADIINAGGGREQITASTGAELKGELQYTIGVDCPAEISAVNVKAIYTNANLFNGKPILKTTGDGKGVALWIYPVGATGSELYWMNDTSREFKLESGQGAVGMKIAPYPGYKSKADIHAGAFSGTISLVFDFVGG
ncbi:fimbrial protein [Salmonella enterica]|nr:fimbrial protein [Salmonella enterica]EDQ6154730.1 fimbrial protein [Salmonella enterica subsp. enterica serovar Javiana]EBR7649417.1 fimbrial protein [Salmonella enterica]EEC5487494.1 fimbrial protein [Salmonella enterica]EEF7968622.1 fimbrial protein [Salmonella enterica]